MTYIADFNLQIDQIIENALQEDVGDGDHSSLACIPSTAMGSAKLLVKDQGFIAGVEFAQRVFQKVDSDLKLEVKISDGSKISYGDIIFIVSGYSHSILKAERLVLNGMQRMSAIATKTKKIVELLEGTDTQVLDTRKTTPGIRALEKWAVRIGGGVNHRFGLYDTIMLKDNHIDFAGGISKAISKTKAYLKSKELKIPIIVEARTINEVREILKHEGILRILLDNFSIENTKKAVDLIARWCEVESSGGIDENNVRSYADCGVNYVSIGALTHSVNNLDLSLKAV